MWERCADLVTRQGGQVHLRHRVEGFELSGRRVTAVTVSTPAGTRRIEAEHFISTLSLRSLIRAFGDRAPAPVRTAAERLSYRDFIIVALVIDRAGVFPDNWIYVHTPGVSVGRVQNFNNWSAALVPQPGTTLLGMEYFCSKGDATWSRSDEELLALATEELKVLDLAPGAKVVDGTVERVLEAYPVYDSTYKESVATVREFLDSLENFHTVGRNGMHKYNNQDHSMFTAMLTVDNLRGASHDVWAVNSDFEYHEEVRLNGSPSGATVAAGTYGAG
jgi:protoporphyrinogen oxidase